MSERYSRTMEQAERVLTNLAAKTPEARAAQARTRRRRNRGVGKRLLRMMIAFALIVAGMFVWGLFVPVGTTGVMIAAVLAILAAVGFGVFPLPRQEPATSQKLSNAEVVHRLDERLLRDRPALPAPALGQVDAISAQLPLLESRLGSLDALDPLAQDARRLMGQHLPDLIDRYQRVPEPLRTQKDAEGRSIEDRLVSGLGAARSAVEELTQRLSEGDMRAFETQERFIESRYKSGEIG